MISYRIASPFSRTPSPRDAWGTLYAQSIYYQSFI